MTSATPRAPTPRTELSLRVLAVSLILLVLVFPVFAVGSRRFVISVFMTAVFFTAVSAVSNRPRYRLIALLLGIPWCVLSWVEVATGDPSPVLLSAVSLLSAFFLVFTLWIVLDFILRADTVTRGVIWGAVAIYLLLGGLWFTIYAFLERTNPGSFLDMAIGGGTPADWTELLYYSFVTLTTLGYGDIVPATLLARHLTIAEAVAGVLYLPIVISRLVGGFSTGPGRLDSAS